MTDRNDDEARTVLFAATLKPYRSLSPRGFALLLMFIGGTCFASGLLFWSMGAWPIAGFFGLDILAIQIAFRLNYRAARACEIVEMTAHELLVRRIAANGRTQEFRFNPYWARLEVDRVPDWGITRMALTSHGKSLSIGGFLNPDDRESFANDFSDALAATRRA
ncbi:DUF2244 domain-containing protein [Kaistia dalseonensis]|uniref:Membrane protein n=1 Tax=Kaistia dalseonensis TaxID=410840 RepID=A0ABU0H6U0_9HYPH|nr:DUF2244 domain-containing protein [Kaistia dalseonensis]MCX5495012.1 DUF2244 domain-containing protein [Kaistia dalseonensis]MDQ0437593.1 putative membrane protein [Kaistia dalseonensis]